MAEAKKMFFFGFSHYAVLVTMQFFTYCKYILTLFGTWDKFLETPKENFF